MKIIILFIDNLFNLAIRRDYFSAGVIFRIKIRAVKYQNPYSICFS